MDLRTTALTLRQLLDATEKQFHAISDEAASRSVGPGRWSRKQILGHLIDSAANNHQRFIRLQLTPELHFPSYQQSDWVSRNQYGERPWAELVSLWTALNRHLAHVIEHIAPETLVNVWDTGSNRYTLGFIVDDYLVHLRHHLEQIMAAG
jgi:hypothetical protein